MWWSLALLFLKELVSGEVFRLWAEHQAKVKAQGVADAPATKAELVELLDEAEV